MASGQRKLGELLVDMGFVRPSDLEHALRVKGDSDEPLGEVLVRLGIITEERVVRALARQTNLEVCDPVNAPVHPKVRARLPPKVARSHRVVPIGMKREGLGEVLYVATSNPLDATTDLEVQSAAGDGVQVRWLLATESEIGLAIEKHYGSGDEEEAPHAAAADAESDATTQIEDEPSDAAALGAERPAVWASDERTAVDAAGAPAVDDAIDASAADADDVIELTDAELVEADADGVEAALPDAETVVTEAEASEPAAKARTPSWADLLQGAQGTASSEAGVARADGEAATSIDAPETEPEGAKATQAAGDAVEAAAAEALEAVDAEPVDAAEAIEVVAAEEEHGAVASEAVDAIEVVATAEERGAVAAEAVEAEGTAEAVDAKAIDATARAATDEAIEVVDAAEAVGTVEADAAQATEAAKGAEAEGENNLAIDVLPAAAVPPGVVLCEELSEDIPVDDLVAPEAGDIRPRDAKKAAIEAMRDWARSTGPLAVVAGAGEEGGATDEDAAPASDPAPDVLIEASTTMAAPVEDVDEPCGRAEVMAASPAAEGEVVAPGLAAESSDEGRSADGARPAAVGATNLDASAAATPAERAGAALRGLEQAAAGALPEGPELLAALQVVARFVLRSGWATEAVLAEVLKDADSDEKDRSEAAESDGARALAESDGEGRPEADAVPSAPPGL